MADSRLSNRGFWDGRKSLHVYLIAFLLWNDLHCVEFDRADSARLNVPARRHAHPVGRRRQSFQYLLNLMQRLEVQY